jgi:hypothetical protein
MARKKTTVSDLKVKSGFEVGGENVTTAELDLIDGVTPGTVAASKAVVPDSNKRVDTLVIGTLKLGAGAGTAVSATAAELNKLAGSGAVVASGTAGAHVADLPAFTDPPTAAEMAALREAVNSILAVQRAFGQRASS